MISTHALHPDSHEFGLADGCPRCAEHAQRPFVGLDDENLAALIERVEAGAGPRSNNERIAMSEVRRILARLGAARRALGERLREEHAL